MSRPDLGRRGLLRGLASLPLIGGSVAVLGRPTAAAEPVTEQLLHSYSAFLFYERRMLRAELGHKPSGAELKPMGWDGGWTVMIPSDADYVRVDNAGGAFHWADRSAASTRAAIVLSAVGCDWRR